MQPAPLKVLAILNWQDYLQGLRLLCWKSTNPNIATLRICACQFDLRLWSTFNNFIMSIGLDHLAFTEKTSFFHLNQNIR